METDKNRDYIRDNIKEIIHNLDDQKKQTLYYISFNLGVLVLTLNGILFSNNSIDMTVYAKPILIPSLILILVSTFLYDNWKGKLHVLRIEATDLLFEEDIAELRKIHYPGSEFYNKHRRIYEMAIWFQRIGIFGYVIFIIFRIYCESNGLA